MKKVFLLLLLTPSFLIAYAQIPAPNIQWQKSYGGTQSERCNGIQQTTDGGYIAAGWTGSTDVDVSGNHGSNDYWVLKLDNAGGKQWQKCLGGTQGEMANAVEQTADGGYIIAGNSQSNDGDVSGNHGQDDFWIVKLNGAGTLKWQKCLGGSMDDQCNSIKQTKDGGYIVAGYSNSSDGQLTVNQGGYDYWLVKLDSVGTLQWQKSYGGSAADYAYSAIQTTDGGYIITGITSSTDGDAAGNTGFHMLTIKTDNAGAIQWKKLYGGSASESGYCIRQTPDGGYITGGNTNSNDGQVKGNHGETDFWVLKTSSTGDVQWQRCLGGSLTETFSDIELTSDGGYIVGGSTLSLDGDAAGNHNGDNDYLLVKLSSVDSIQWTKCLGGIAYDDCYAVQQTSDGGYIAAGISDSKSGDVTTNNGLYDFWIVKLAGDATGINSPAGINKTDLFSIYPNPNNGSFDISFSSVINNGQLQVLNAIGEEIYTFSSVSGRNLYPSLHDLHAGVYFIRLFTNEGMQIKKLVIE